jgi:hypothetical protein
MRKISVHTNCSDIDGSLEHDYDIINEDFYSTTEMYRSEAKDWTTPREKIITCQEDEQKGEYKFTITNTNLESVTSKKKITLDTSEAYELFILLGFLYENDRIEYRESTVIKSI